MVRHVEISNQEVGVVGAEVLSGAKLYRQCDLPQGLVRLPRNDSLEWRVHRGEVFLGEP
jgi:hypothetical protein